MSDAYQTYPLTMTHPGYQPAKSTPVPGKPGEPIDYIGTPERLAPVQVGTSQEEGYYEAQGYQRAGKVDPSAWVKSHSSAPPDTYVPQRYPMWVEGKLVNNEAEEAEALGLGDLDEDEFEQAPMTVGEAVVERQKRPYRRKQA